MVSCSFLHPTKVEREGEARDWTETLYFIFQTLVGLNLITESKYHIQGYKNKTTTIVVFTISIYTVLSPFTYTYTKTVHLHLHIQSTEPTCDEPLLVC